MSIQKPSKPDVTLPDNFGGTKTPYSEAQIRDGYLQGVPEIVDGGNINYEKDALFQKVKYCETIADVINGILPNNTIAVDSNNRFTYTTQVQMATDAEFQAGTSELKVPNVKQTKTECKRIESIMDNYVDKTSKQNISGVKTITGDGCNLYMQSNSISYNTASSSWMNKTIAFTDKNNGNLGVVEITKDPRNINNIYLNIFGPKDTWCPIPLGLRATSEGTFGSSAPICNWDNSIVTTVSHGTNHVRFGNGIQICFGNSAVNQVIAFQQPFKDAGYKVAFCQTDNAEHNINNTIVDKTTTSFKFNRGYRGDWIAIGYWY